MMDGEDVYRTRLKACLAAADASSLPQVRDRHLAAAASWRVLLEEILERERGVVAIPSDEDAQEADAMSDTFEIPETVINALGEGTPSVRAFRQSAGLAQHDVAAQAGMTDKRLAEIEHGATPKGLELAVLSDVLEVPVDLLTDE